MPQDKYLKYYKDIEIRGKFCRFLNILYLAETFPTTERMKVNGYSNLTFSIIAFHPQSVFIIWFPG
jgi:hypothetical protein